MHNLVTLQERLSDLTVALGQTSTTLSSSLTDLIAGRSISSCFKLVQALCGICPHSRNLPNDSVTGAIRALGLHL